MRIAIVFVAWVTFFNSTAPGLHGSEAVAVAIFVSVAVLFSFMTAVIEDIRKAFGK